MRTHFSMLPLFSCRNAIGILEINFKRIAVVTACLETDYERREFMKAVINAGMNTDDYTYIFLETRKRGYGKVSRYLCPRATSV